MVDIGLDIDIWGYGRDAGQAGRLTLEAMKAAYPHFEVTHPDIEDKLWDILPQHLERTHNDQRTWRFFYNYIFFICKEDMELARALLYIY